MIKSYYDLTFEETKKLEDEFRSLEQGRFAYQVWIFNNVVGVCIASISTFFFVFLSFFQKDNFAFLFLLSILLGYGILIVYSATLEYYKKYNSWLFVSKNIVRDSILIS